MTLNLNRGESVVIPFAIVAESGLADKRVTWCLAHAVGDAPALIKKSDVGTSSAEIVIASMSATQIIGSINLLVVDFDLLPRASYNATLWVDSDTGDDACVTPGGADLVVIVPNVERAP